jgi:hypothetical protein
VAGFTIGSRGKVPGKICKRGEEMMMMIIIIIIRFISFIYVLDNSHVRPITAKH